MYLSKTRLIIGDGLIVGALAFTYSVTYGFKQNVLAVGLVIALLIVRSAFWHVKWYKTTGKIY